MTLATHEEVIEPEIVLSFSEHVEAVNEHHESFKFHRGKTVEAAILTGQALSAAKKDLAHGKWARFLGSVGMSQRYAHQFMQIGSNLNQRNCADLPTSSRALYELSRLDPEDIEAGIESGAINPNMKISEAKSFTRADWPVVPEPTPEEREEQFEQKYQELIDEGYIPKPPTEEERKAEAQEFIQSLIGNRRTQEPVTAEDKFAKALNAVGAAIRINHGVNETLLNEDGWNVLRALGLR